jgi:4-amino-4-deoxy-L-arabinose transferase-like glycosyltransferase
MHLLSPPRLALPRIPLARLAPLALGAWCAFLFLYGVAAGPLYRTEALRAIIGRECANGNWLYPVLYGEPFLTKPPGHYAAVGLCSLPFGEVTAATARLPSVFAATVTVFLVYGLFRRAIGEGAALVAALLLPCSVLWLDKVPSAEIDMSLVGWVTAAICALYRAVEAEDEERGALRWWLLALACVAGGALTKWTAPAFFYLTAGTLFLWRGRFGLLFRRNHVLAVSAALALCALWAGAVVREVGWDALAGTLRKEAAYRFAPKASKGYPWAELALYPLAVVAAHLPVAVFALVTFRRSFWEALAPRARLLAQLLHCWTWPNLLFWTLVPNHNVRYALPMSAGLMGLGALGLLYAFRASPRGLRSAAVAFLACWLVAKVAFVEVVIPNRTAGRNAEATAAELRAAVPEGAPLYVFKLKDEGVTFYYARPVLKLADPRALPPGAFAVLIRQERADPALAHLVPVVELRDQQGAPIWLARAP